MVTIENTVYTRKNTLVLMLEGGKNMAQIDVTELDIFYISYDEPNAEENWADLMNKVPWAKRIHGVKGFDAAHKAAANQSETERFITVDGDNKVLTEFFD